MATKKLTCTADVSISQKYPGNAYNTADRLAFGAGAASGDNYYALLKFSTLDLDPNLYEISKAVLTLTKISGTLGFNAAFSARAVRVTSAWSESTDYDAAPSVTTTGASTAVSVGTGHSGSFTLDVTAIVKAWQSGSAQYGVRIEKTTSGGSMIKTLADRTASGAAYITVTYTEREPEPTAPKATAPGTITADSKSFQWSASTDNVFASAELSYQVQVTLDGGTTWSSSYTAAAGETSLSVNLRSLAGLKTGQYYYNTKLKFRVRAVTPAFNGTVYYSSWTTSAAGVINYKKSPSAPASLKVSASAPYEGQSLTVTVGRPSTYNAYDADGNVMQLTYTVKYKDGTVLGTVTAACTSATAAIEITVPNKTSGKANLATSVTATVKDAEGQTSTATSAVSLTIMRYRKPIVTITSVTRTEAAASVKIEVTDTGYGGTQSSSQIAKVERKLANGSWTAVTPSWTGLADTLSVSGLDEATSYSLQVRITSTVPSGLTAKVSTAAKVTIPVFMPPAMIFYDSANNSRGIAAKSLRVSKNNWGHTLAEGRAWIEDLLMLGNKSYINDGNTGVYLNGDGYMHLQRSSADGYHPYLGFYLDDATSADGIVRLNSSSKIMEFINAAGYRFDSGIYLPNGKTIYGYGTDGAAYNVFFPKNSNNDTIVGYDNYYNANGNTRVYGHDVVLGVANLAKKSTYRPYLRTGDSISLTLRLTGYVTDSAKQVCFLVPLTMPIIGAPTVTAASSNGFIFRQDNKYTHGSASNTYVKPDSYSASANNAGVLITATFSTTTNATNNDTIGILWSGTITFS